MKKIGNKIGFLIFTFVMLSSVFVRGAAGVVCKTGKIQEIQSIQEIVPCVKPGSLIVLDMDETLIGFKNEQLKNKLKEHKGLINPNTLTILQEINGRGAHILLVSNAKLYAMVERLDQVGLKERQNVIDQFKALISLYDQQGVLKVDNYNDDEKRQSYVGRTKAGLVVDYIGKHNINPSQIIVVDDRFKVLKDMRSNAGLKKYPLIRFRLTAWDNQKAFKALVDHVNETRYGGKNFDEAYNYAQWLLGYYEALDAVDLAEFEFGWKLK